MGNAGSHHPDEEDHNDHLDPFDGIETLGYRVLGVQPGSPASKAGLVSFLDFLVGCEQKMLLGSGEDLEPGQEYDDVDLPAFLDEKKGQELEFLVWNIKSQTARLVNLTPSDTWGGAGLLGVTIRLDNYAGAEDRLVRVLHVEPNSPAAIAGLIADEDFLLGTTHQTLDSVDCMAALLRQQLDQVVELYVYNSSTDMVRIVALMPTYNWDGRGMLGAEVGTGYLHRLPAAARATSGVSVERKVRYVNAAITTEQYPHNGGKQLLENEPQLEMEPAGTDEEDEVESVALDAPKPAARKDPTPIAAAPASASALPEQERAVPARAPSSFGLSPKEIQAIFDRPPLKQTPTPEKLISSPTKKYISPSSAERALQRETTPEQRALEQQLRQAEHTHAVPPPLQHQSVAAQQASLQQPYQALSPRKHYPGQHQHYQAADVQQQRSGGQQQHSAYAAPPQQQYFAAATASSYAAAAPPVNSYAAAQPPVHRYSASSAPSVLGPPPPAYYGAATTALSYSNPSNSSEPPPQYGSRAPSYSYGAAPAVASYDSAASLPPAPQPPSKQLQYSTST